VAVQTDLVQVKEWAAELELVCERVAPRFRRVEVRGRSRVGAVLRGLLAGWSARAAGSRPQWQ